MASEADASWVCPACGYVPVDEAERRRHEAGTDEKHLECAHQDIEAIKAQQQAQQRGQFFGRGWG